MLVLQLLLYFYHWKINQMDTPKICRICVDESYDLKKILHSTVEFSGKEMPVSNILSVFDIKLVNKN